jgi:hypothetical protein
MVGASAATFRGLCKPFAGGKERLVRGVTGNRASVLCTA